MQNNPDDDVMKNIIRKVVEDVIRTLPNAEGARIIGYTVITGFPGDEKKYSFPGAPEDDTSIPYEIIESDDTIYITATIPAQHECAPFADINPGMVRICVDDKIASIDLPCMIDVVHSSYEFRRGVIDIRLKKAKKLQSYVSGPGA